MDIWVAVILVVFGLLFLALEVFVFPGVGISGIVGVIALGVGVFIAFKLNTYIGILTLIGSIVGGGLLTKIALKSGVFNKMLLSKNIDSKVQVNHENDLQVGEEGITISRLSPMGKARFNQFYCEVSSWDGFVNENTPIQIVKIENNTIYVSPLKSK